MLSIKLIRDLITQALSEGKNFKNGIPEIENIYDDNFQWVKENAINTDLRLSELENNQKAYFFGIDTTNLLTNGTIKPNQPFNWTATDNGYIVINYLAWQNSNVNLTIDGVAVGFAYMNDSGGVGALMQSRSVIPVVKGQVVKCVTTTQTYSPTIAIYGLKKVEVES